MMGAVKYFWWLFSTVATICVIMEAASWCLLELRGRPEFTYYASYMNGYLYHPYMAYHPEVYPIYQAPNSLAAAPSVVLLGGSTAAGVGPRDGKNAFFRVMEERLAARGTPIFLRNYAAPGLVSSQEEAAYKYYVFPETRKNVIVALTSFNDIYFYLFRTLPVGNHEFNYAFEKVFRNGYPDPPDWKGRLSNFARRTYIFGILHSVWSQGPIQLSSLIYDPHQPNFSEPVSEKTIRKAADNFLNNSLALALLARERGGKYLVVLQPIIFYSGQIERKQNAGFSRVADLEKWVHEVGVRKPEYDHFFALILDGLRRMKSKGLLDYLDFRAALHGEVFLDPVHFNDQASRDFGLKLADELARRL
jgi:hypothetical protein